MFTDTPLSDTDRKAIHDFALDARAQLMIETRDMLEGVYGLTADGKLSPLSKLPNLSNDAEGRLTHDRLGRFLDDEVRAGLDRREAVDKLVKEVAFTHLNRFVAFKMLEARKLIRQTVSRGKDSNGFKFYLADRPEEEAQWRSGEAGADATYRRFILWQCDQIAREVKVLFDAANLPSRLFPRPTALRALLERLNADDLTPAWASAETIGWVYQYFNEGEKAEVFDRLYKKKQKIRREDIPAATQLFTPRWIVRFLVENTLGRTWVELHPDSRLASELRYLVPLTPTLIPNPSPSKEEGGNVRAVKDITLLDPACGTMHFGLVAFDLFAEMYREEIEHAGQPGWPDRPSAAIEAEIPAAIIAHNLFGIDIDLRAVQLSALTLYLKAKELNKAAVIDDHNLACADVLALNGERLNTFLKEMNFQKPAYERLIRALWARLKDINQLGSLLRLEDEIAALVKQERERYEKEGRQPDLFGERPRFEDEAAREEYWDIVGAQLIQAFDEFARRAAARGGDEAFFTGEATKGLRLLDLMLRRYDCVVTNPPYLGRRNMNTELADAISKYYPFAKGDAYTAFIARCCEFLKDDGRQGMLTVHSFMFISSYEETRSYLAERVSIETVGHLGTRTIMDLSNPNAQGFVMFVVRAENDRKTRDESIGTYFRLVSHPDLDSKQNGFEQALIDGTDTYRVSQEKFQAIPGAPWVYWITSGLRQLFQTLPNLGKVAQPRQGLATADNFRFLRFWWEGGLASVDFSCSEVLDTAASMKTWFPYMKGGGFCRWYGNHDCVVNWANDGKEIKNFGIESGKTASRPQNTDYYFRKGITYSYLTSATFSARYSPGGFIFDVAGSSLFPEDIPVVLAVMNSTFAAYALKLINPTVNFQVGDLARLPTPNVASPQSTRLVSNVIAHARAENTHDELAYDFIAPLHWNSGLQDVTVEQTRMTTLERQIDDEVYRLYGISAEDRAAIEAEVGDQRMAAPNGLTDGDNAEATDEQSAADGEEEADQASGITQQELAVRWVSYAIGIIVGRFQPGVAGALGSAVYRREDFAIGSLPMPDEAEFDQLVGATDRFAYVDAKGGRHVFSAEVETQLGALADKDGIVVLDENHPDDLPAKVEAALELMLGERGAAEVVAALNGDDVTQHASHTTLELDRVALRKFLERDFFSKWHVKWYRKRPIYWLLQSPKKSYGLYLFHERITKDTLFVVQRKYLDGKIKRTQQELAEARANAEQATSARDRRALNKAADDLEKVLADLAEFGKRLKAITDRGYDPDIDDGVILNLAPLADVIPAWSKEPQKYWDGLEAGDYDWAHLAMKYWPDRVKQKCKTDKSLAIAHGLA